MDDSDGLKIGCIYSGARGTDLGATQSIYKTP